MTVLHPPIRLLLLLCAFANATPAAHAAVPGQVDFQGLLLDSGGSAVNGQVDLLFRLFDVESGGTALWSESHDDVDVLDGVYDVALGSAAPLDASLLEGGVLYLEVEVEGETLVPRQRLLAVPYAIRAGTAETAEALSGPLDADLVIGTTEAGDPTSWSFLTWLLGSDQYPADTDMSVGPTCGNPQPRGFCVDDNVGVVCEDDGVCGSGSCQLTTDCVFNMVSVNEGRGSTADESLHSFNDSWEYSFHYDTYGQKLEHNWDLRPAHFAVDLTGVSGSFAAPSGSCSEGGAVCSEDADCAGICNLDVKGETLSFSSGARGRVVSWDGGQLEYVHIFGETPLSGETLAGDESGASATLATTPDSVATDAWRPFQWVSDVWSGLRAANFGWWVTPASRALFASPRGVAIGQSGGQTGAALLVYNSFGRNTVLSARGVPKASVNTERAVLARLDLELEQGHSGGSATGLEVRARRQGSNDLARLSTLRGIQVSAEHRNTGSSSLTTNLYGVDVDLDLSGADQQDEVSNAYAIHVDTPGGCGADGCLRQHAGILVEDQGAIGRRYSHAIFVRSQSPDAAKGNLSLEGGGWNDGHIAVGDDVPGFMDHLWRDQTNEVWRISTDAVPASETDGAQLLTSAMEASDPCGAAPTGYVFFNDADATGFYCFCDKSGSAAQLHQPAAACF